MDTRVRGPGRRATLRGRAGEWAALDALLSDVRGGRSRSLVLRGEAGIGKTALIECLIEAATDVTVLKAAGVESEMEFTHANLHQLCAPLLDRLGRLPAPQRDALRVVFGLSEGRHPRSSWSASRFSACSPTRLRAGRCSALSTTRNGLTGPPH
jgi:AAA ATPase domain